MPSATLPRSLSELRHESAMSQAGPLDDVPLYELNSRKLGGAGVEHENRDARETAAETLGLEYS